MAKVILDIHRKKIKTHFILVPLFDIKQIHVIDRENAIKATEKRVESLLGVAEEIKKKKNITREILAEYLPSISWIKVVEEREKSYIAYEGNGRLVAMQKAFQKEDDINVEVEEYCFKNTKKIIRRMNRVRKLNGLI